MEGWTTWEPRNKYLFFAKIPNFYYMFLAKNNIEQYSNFDVIEFQSSPWMVYNDNTCLVGFFTGLIFSLFTVYLVRMFNKSRSIFLQNIFKNVR